MNRYPTSTLGSVAWLLTILFFIITPLAYLNHLDKQMPVEAQAQELPQNRSYPVIVTEPVTPSQPPSKGGVQDSVLNEEQQKIITYIREVFGKDAEDAIKVARCESGLRADAQGTNSNSSTDTGVFQINSVHGINPAYLKDYRINIDVAYKMFKEQGWNPWVCVWKNGVINNAN